MVPAPRDIFVGDVVQTRKPHPCGSDRWQVYRIGADIGLRCLGCEHRVMMPRRQFEKALKQRISHVQDGTESGASETSSTPQHTKDSAP